MQQTGRSGTLSKRKQIIACGSLAAAASLLLAVGTLLRMSDPGKFGVAATEGKAYDEALGLTEHGRFDEARAVVAEARRRGTESDRLRSIESQALRQIRGALALAHIGRLTDFGFEIGGATARSAVPGRAGGQVEQALAVLAKSSSDDDLVALNRGHALLTLDRPREALAEFQRVTGRTPGAPLARLGEGLAFFALAEYPSAENSFRACFELDPNQITARINLAMTLSEEGKTDLALAAWDEVLAQPQSLSSDDRRAIAHEVAELRKASQRQPSPPPGSGSLKKEDQ
jgi:tetratricopeptide (TPR) repeat protein